MLKEIFKPAIYGKYQIVLILNMRILTDLLKSTHSTDTAILKICRSSYFY